MTYITRSSATAARFAAVALVAMLGACVAPADNGEPTTPTKSGSFQNERVHADAGVRIWIPEHWDIEDTGGNIMTVSDPNDEIAIMFMVVDGDDLLSALASVGAGLLTEVDDVQLVGTPEEADVNGMDALFQDGTGVASGIDVELSVGVLVTPTDKFLLVVGIAESAVLQRHARTVLEILHGLKPVSA